MANEIDLESIDVLFENFGIDPGIRMDFTTELTFCAKDGKSGYMFVALLKDGRYISQYDRDGGYHPFKEVWSEWDRDNVVKIFYIPVKSGLPSHYCILPTPECKPIIKYFVRQNSTMRDLLYMIGFHVKVKGENKQVARYIKSDGDYRDGPEGLDFKWRDGR